MSVEAYMGISVNAWMRRRVNARNRTDIKGLSKSWDEEMLGVAFFHELKCFFFPCIPIRTYEEDDTIRLDRLIGIGKVLGSIPN